MDKGWRRSGTLMYRPDNELSCCALYTIRLPIDKFKISKEQKKVLRHFDNYIDHGNIYDIKEKKMVLNCSYDEELKKSVKSVIASEKMNINLDINNIKV